MSKLTYTLDPRYHREHLYRNRGEAMVAVDNLISQLPESDWQYEIGRDWDYICGESVDIFIFSRKLGVRIFPVSHSFYSCAPFVKEYTDEIGEPLFEVVSLNPSIAVAICSKAIHGV